MAEEPQSQAMEIRERYGAERARILTECFELPLLAAQEGHKVIKRTLSSNVGKDAQQKVLMAEAEAAGRALRQDCRERFIQSELEEQAALAALAEHLEEALSPESLTAADVAAASVLSEEQLASSADAVAAMPNSDNVLKTFLAIARQKEGYEMAAHHIAELLGPEVQMALTDLDICAESTDKPEEDIAAEFDAYAVTGEPDGASILAAAQNDLNLMSLLR